jgi:uncharacterized protein
MMLCYLVAEQLEAGRPGTVETPRREQHSGDRPASPGVARAPLASNPKVHEVRVATRGEAGPDSDIDLLIDLETGRTLLDLAALRGEATQLLGRPVDIATIDMLRDQTRREAERDALAV